MRKSIIILFLATTGFFSCRHGSKPTPDSTKNAQSQKALTENYEKYIDTKYAYSDSIGMGLIIQNSFPKSGINYTGPNGRKYVYAVFWTQMINETNNPFELTIDFPLNAFELSSSPGNYIKLLIPSDSIALDKLPLFDYGLAVKSFLDNNIHKPSSLKRTINPKGSSGFYVVTLSNHGVNGTLRTGLGLKGQDLFYRINDKEIHCGSIDLKDLMLKK